MGIRAASVNSVRRKKLAVQGQIEKGHKSSTLVCCMFALFAVCECCKEGKHNTQCVMEA